MSTEARELRNEPDLLPAKVTQGRDELNLAEFPLSAIAERLDPAQKTLTFEDHIWDESRGDNITRQLTITASDQYGLPTALDDEVILGLVQISKLNDFADRRVSFTRYQLIRLLGWNDDSKSYERIEKSLNRWVGITLYYKNAWWDKESKSWVDEKFHIIDNVTLYDRDKAKLRKATSQGSLPLSTFTWNDVLFRSFKVGNLKSLDFDFYKSLDSAIAKRLYRFLDKRFWHRSRWEFNLKEVSWEHIGLSRNYDAANLKRRLLAGIRELEERGFLQRMLDADRFKKVRSGEWRVVFEKVRQRGVDSRTDITKGVQSLVQALIDRGVTKSTAEQTVSNYPADRIQSQLEVFDWLVTKQDPKVSRNPAGFLLSSIKSEYVPPKGFISRDDLARRQAKELAKKEREEEQARVRREAEVALQQRQEAAIAGFWKEFSDDERFRMEAEVLATATAIQVDVIARGGPFAEATRKSLLDGFALKTLREAG